MYTPWCDKKCHIWSQAVQRAKCMTQSICCSFTCERGCPSPRFSQNASLTQWISSSLWGPAAAKRVDESRNSNFLSLQLQYWPNIISCRHAEIFTAFSMPHSIHLQFSGALIYICMLSFRLTLHDVVRLSTQSRSTARRKLAWVMARAILAHFPCRPLQVFIFPASPFPTRYFSVISPPFKDPYKKNSLFDTVTLFWGLPALFVAPSDPPFKDACHKKPICRHPFAPFMGLFASPFKDPYKNFYFLTPHTFPLQRPLQITLFF